MYETLMTIAKPHHTPTEVVKLKIDHDVTVGSATDEQFRSWYLDILNSICPNRREWNRYAVSISTHNQLVLLCEKEDLDLYMRWYLIEELLYSTFYNKKMRQIKGFSAFYQEGQVKPPVPQPPVRGRRECCLRGHAFTPENTAIYDGDRICKTCSRERAKNQYYRQKSQKSKKQATHDKAESSDDTPLDLQDAV